MKRKIHNYLLFTVFVTLMATLVMAVAIFHHIYQEQIIEDMQTYTSLLHDMAESSDELEARYRSTDPELRVTIISEDGEVRYDSKADFGVLDNHAERPEVKTALENGSGYAIRHSDTLDRDMYYYAELLESGEVLRISKEDSSIWSTFSSTLRGIIGIGILMFLVCFVMARGITDNIVRPIRKMADEMDQIENLEVYEELVPFITTIRQQHDDIMKSAKLRQEFTANVSHELKTPLTSISGYAELIATGMAGEEDVQRFAHQIHRSSRRLLTLINDIIRLSELDSEQQERIFTTIDLQDISATCVEMLTMNAEQHQIEISFHGEKCQIQGNREMMEELLYNLCDNAIRYNRPGGTVKVSTGERNGRPFVTVQDTGIGIPKESQGRVFERFYRVDKSRSKMTGGTGLGLAIVKHIVAQHHAEIQLNSEYGKGTEITIIF